MQRKRTRKHRLRIGAVVVEMAIVLPILLMVVFGIVEFGRAMAASNLITAAARHGSRRAVLDQSTNADVIALVTNQLSQTLSVDPTVIEVTLDITPDPENPDPGGQLANCEKGDLCTVTIQVPFSELSFLPAEYLTDTQLTATCTMEHE